MEDREMARYIGIRHRTKGKVETEEQEAQVTRPTQVFILEDGKEIWHDLKTEIDELDFLLDRFTVAWRSVEDTEDVSNVFPRHLKTQRLKKDEDASQIHPSQIIETDKGRQVVIKVATAFEGFRAGDIV